MDKPTNLESVQVKRLASVGKKLRQQISTESSSGVSTKQALVYFGIVVACFVVIYPRMIHPMVKMALGFGGNSNSENAKKGM